MLYKSEKLNIALAHTKKTIAGDRFFLLSTLIGIAVLHLGLTWKAMGNIDQLVTDSLFWGVILWLLWQKENSLKYKSYVASSFVGWLLLSLVFFKTIGFLEFESIFLSFLPIFTLLPVLLIASGFKGLRHHLQELFFALFLFFPTGAIGYLMDRYFKITVINAKVATYFLYYLGFDTVSQGNEVILNLPEIGKFKAIVGLPCAGIPMIVLILRISLLLISCVCLSKKKQILLPSFSLVLGFLLGVVRVCLLTLLIPYQAQFDYWHGDNGSQIFSTLAIVIFSAFCYWIMEKDRQSKFASD